VVIGFIQTSTGLAAIPKTLNLVVNPPPGPSIRTTSLPNAIQNTPYHATLEASPGSAGTWSVNGGNLLLPLGIVLDQNTGVLGGSSVAVGNYTETFVFTPTDTSIAPVSAKLNLRVVAFAANQFDAIVSAGGSSTCRIGQDQALSCWGYNDAGQLGTGGAQQIDPPGVLKPVRVGSATDWTAISVSGNPLPTEGHACGLRGTTAYCWGSDLHNMLGSNSVTGSETSPVLVPGSLAWQSISAGWTNSCGVTTGGKLYCWGDNSFSQLGTSAGDKAAPTQVGTDTDWESVSTGYTSTCAVKASGSLYCWGANSRGQLGVGSTDSQPTPAQAGTASWTSVAVGDGYACGRQVDGTIYCWGPSSHGQLGNGVSTNSSLTDVTSPLKVGAATDWVSLTTGGGQTCAVNLAGELWCWGSNSDYQVGDATTTDRTVPTRIGTGTSWHSVTAGNLHTCAAQTTGDVYCWGSNNKGRAGINSGVVVDVQTPTMVVG
jgi:alpha-tubulin suppressor-like RCC1 family protein